jgi:hypothetical protein
VVVDGEVLGRAGNRTRALNDRDRACRDRLAIREAAARVGDRAAVGLPISM